MAYEYERGKAMEDLAAMANRNRPLWMWAGEGTWSYVDRAWLWRATVAAAEDGFCWEFRSTADGATLGEGSSPDIAVMFRAVKAGPAKGA